MNLYSGNALTSIVLVTVVFGLFIFGAANRIRNSLKALHTDNTSKPWRALRKLDLVFSGVFLVASIAFYAVFLLNIGR